MVWIHLPIHVIILDVIIAVLDIFIITLLFYKFYQILAQTKAVQVLKGLFFFVAFFKIFLISVIFYPISRISESAVLFYILGLSIIVFATMVEGMIQLVRNFSNGRT